MATGDVVLVKLRRYDTSQPWGFKMQGGADFGLPLFIAQVSPKGIAGTAGLMDGDGILKICRTLVTGWTHDRAKAEMIRTGNDLDLTVQRGMVNTQDPRVQAAGQAAAGGRVELVEESIDPRMNEGSKFRQVTPKTYQILEKELDAKEQQVDSAGTRPASIFDRKKPQRSGYLVAQGKTIQKTYGES
ncbi:PDZ and LIM domain protein 3-like [Gigantopelta aegis]|uniref:PDZ and LIM domain protein 3-like n=1 Tax=Gigantopelta aegis TaxID=1735272 RepID=UPI001B88D9B2|nr:PDZ and LIM domain protein 3-like [Gigantopelta aegis]